MTDTSHIRQITLLIVFVIAGLVFEGCGQRKTEEHTLRLKPVCTVEKSAGMEISGLAKSLIHKEVYWAINDSGNPPAIVPLSKKGEIKSKSGRQIIIPEARNIDWEALAIDRSGTMYICDVGNNYSKRKKLQIYRIPEPSLDCNTTQKPEIITVRYPDQPISAPSALFFDCEAAFIFNKKLYLLTKRLQDSSTTLYRLDSEKQNATNTLTLLSNYPVGGYVTDADISPDQNVLAVLTYKALWLFYDFHNDNFFDGKKKVIHLQNAGQIESVVFTSPDELLLVNETKNELFTVKLVID